LRERFAEGEPLAQKIYAKKDRSPSASGKPRGSAARMLVLCRPK